MFVNILARRENERPAAEQVNMKMKDRLPAVGVRVDDDAVAVFGETLFARDFGGRQKQPPERLLMIFPGLVERIEMLARNDQDMRRRLRADVVKSDASLVFINARRRNRAVDDLTKKTIFTHNGKFSIKSGS